MQALSGCILSPLSRVVILFPFQTLHQGLFSGFRNPSEEIIIQEPRGQESRRRRFHRSPPLSGADLRHSQGTHGSRVGHGGSSYKSPIPRPIQVTSTPIKQAHVQVKRRKQSCTIRVRPARRHYLTSAQLSARVSGSIHMLMFLESVSPRGPQAVQWDV